MDAQRVEESNAAIQPEFLSEGDEARFHMAFAVNVELRAGQAASQFVERAHRDVQSLVPLQSAGKKNYRMTVGLRARPGLKDVRVHVVDEHRTFFWPGRARCVF